jgi:hypothetical protein
MKSGNGILINNFLNSTRYHTQQPTHYTCCVLHCWNPRKNQNKVYVIGIEHVEGDVFRLVTHYGPRGRLGSLQKVEKAVHTFGWCYDLYQKLVIEKLNKGYEYVNTYDYHRSVPGDQHISDLQVLTLLNGFRLADGTIQIADKVKAILDTRSDDEKFMAELILG